MKQVYLSALFAVCCLFTAEGQQSPLFQAYYQFTGVTNLQQPERKSMVTWTLQIDSSGSSFFDPIKREADSIYALDVQAGMDPVQLLANAYKYRRGTGFQCYTNTSIGKMLVYDNLSVYYKYEEKLPLQEWQLHADNMTILGQLAYKATTTFRGRAFTAWYCPDIPFTAGPWKFGGLPGLILFIRDEQGHYEFKCIGMETVNGRLIKSFVPDARTNTYPDFAKLRRLRAENPEAFLSVMAPGINISPTNKSGKTSLKQAKNGRARFNPLELDY